MKTAVSVIIPVYNGERTLQKCLNSVLNQTYKNYEIIVVDNNSTDKTKDIIKEFQSKNKKVKYLFEPKRGRAIARNLGIRNVKSSIIVMTDADCIVPEDWIGELTKPIIHEKESVVRGVERDLIKNYWSKNIQKSNWKFLKRNIKGKYINDIDTKNFAIRSSLIKKLMFDSNLETLEDFDLYLRLKKITKIRFKPSVRVGHNHKSSFASVTKIYFDRAYWTRRIYRKYKNSEIKNEAMFENISFRKFLLFPFWMAFQFIKKPIGEAFFLLISETSWRIGLLCGIINKS